MGVDVTTEIVIGAPVGDVADFAANPDNVAAWYGDIRTIEWQTPKPLRIGSRLTFVAQFLGRELNYTYEVVEFEPGRQMTMRTAEGPFPMETTYTWSETADGRTLMTLRNRGEPSGSSSMLAPLMAGRIRKTTQNDLRILKSIVEKRVSGMGDSTRIRPV